MEIKKKYTNGEVTITWEPSKCIHSTICWKKLPQVFDPRKRPWITIEGDTTERMVEQVKACPSGALGYYMNHEENQAQTVTETIIEPLPNGPLLVYGTIKIKDAEGNLTVKNQTTALCRCGRPAWPSCNC